MSANLMSAKLMFAQPMRIALAMFAAGLVAVPVLAGPAMDVAAPTQAAASASSALDVPIVDIAASARGRAILDKDFPGLCTHTMYGFFKSMSLNQIAAMSHGEITPSMLAQARTDLSALPIATAAQDGHQAEALDFDSEPRGTKASVGDGHPHLRYAKYDYCSAAAA